MPLSTIIMCAHQLRNPARENDIVRIWRLELETYTEEMLGRDTPPMSTTSCYGEDSGLSTSERRDLAIPPSSSENEATSKQCYSSDSYDQKDSDSESHGWESDRSRTST